MILFNYLSSNGQINNTDNYKSQHNQMLRSEERSRNAQADRTSSGNSSTPYIPSSNQVSPNQNPYTYKIESTEQEKKRIADVEAYNKIIEQKNLENANEHYTSIMKFINDVKNNIKGANLKKVELDEVLLRNYNTYYLNWGDKVDFEKAGKSLENFKKFAESESFYKLFDYAFDGREFPITALQCFETLYRRFPEKKDYLNKNELVVMSYYMGASRGHLLPNKTYENNKGTEMTYPQSYYELATLQEQRSFMQRFDVLEKEQPETALLMAGYCRKHLNPFLLNALDENTSDSKKFESYKKVLYSKYSNNINETKISKWREIAESQLNSAVKWLKLYHPEYLNNLSIDDWLELSNSQSIKPDYIAWAVRDEGVIKNFEDKFPNLKKAIKEFDKNLRKSGIEKLDLGENTFFYGTTKSGKPHGKGKCNYSNGNYYEGDFLDGDKHGKGKYTFANGDLYVGDFVKDIKKGFGEMIYNNNTTYKGEWNFNAHSGKGVLTDFNSGTVYEGTFLYGLMNGIFLIKYKDGTTATGNVINGNSTGNYVFKRVNGNYKEAVYEYGKLVSEKFFNPSGVAITSEEYMKK